MNIFWAAQILGAIAVLIQVVTFQQNKRINILFGSMIAQILFIVHFLLLGGFTGAAVNVIGASRNAIFAKSKKIIKSQMWLWVFLGCQLLVAVLTWKSLLSGFALAGSWLSTLAFWQNNPRNIRRTIIFMPLCWVVYNYFLHSYVGMISNGFVFTSTAIAIYRYDFAPNNLSDSKGDIPST